METLWSLNSSYSREASGGIFIFDLSESFRFVHSRSRLHNALTPVSVLFEGQRPSIVDFRPIPPKTGDVESFSDEKWEIQMWQNRATDSEREWKLNRQRGDPDLILSFSEAFSWK
jgi:hypothetical protein